jgi:ankyrin repeat protein
MDMLLEVGANLTEHDDLDYTPLHLYDKLTSACAYGHHQIASALIQKGADPLKKNSRGWAPIDYSYSNTLFEYIDSTLDSLDCLKAFSEKRPMPVLNEDRRILDKPPSLSFM